MRRLLLFFLIACRSKPALDDGGIFTCTGKEDCDGDGYVAPADCDDANPFVGPEAYDFPNNGIDDDCDGTKDNPVLACETTGTTPMDHARAADLCPQRSKNAKGMTFDPLERAEWGQVKGYGPGQRLWTSQTKPTQVAIASSFGNNGPRQGKTMLGMATGPWAAMAPRNSAPLDDPMFKLTDACSDIPLSSDDCKTLSNGGPAGGVSVQDWAELTLWLKVPANARALAFDFAFYSTEFNQFWNASLNDAFFVLVTSKDVQGKNVAVDDKNRAMTINNGFFQLCPKYPGPMGLSPEKLDALKPCVGTDGDPMQNVIGTLAGTGYDGAPVMGSNGMLYLYGGGSGWLTSRFTVTGGDSIQVRVIVHDTFDGYKDSAVLVDRFRWEPAPASGFGRPPT